MNIASLGVGSGINVRELVDNLIEAEGKQKSTRFDLVESKGIKKIAAYELLRKALSEFKDKIEGMRIDPLDIEATKKTAQAFVENYNIVFSTLRHLTAVDKIGNENGPLLGDATTRNFEFKMRKILNDTGVALIGISSNAATGNLLLDENKLESVLKNDFSKVEDCFMNSKSGVLVKMKALVNQQLVNNGFIQNATDSVVRSLKKVNEQRELLALRLEKKEKRLMAQFIAMDKIVGKLKTTGDFLTSHLETLSQPLSERK